MARRRQHEEHVNHERWLVSYADFITLLFAFFVVMFATSEADKGKAQALADSVKKAISNGAQTPSQAPTRPQEAKPDARSNASEIEQAAAQLKQALGNELTEGKISMHQEPRGLVVSLRQGAFFPSGDDTIAPDSYGSIAKLADVLRDLHLNLQLEGHTDSVPIHNARFDSNWDLSAARSVAVLHLLCSRFHLQERRFGVAGYADTMPADSNTDEAARAHNRRVDVVLMAKSGERESVPGHQ